MWFGCDMGVFFCFCFLGREVFGECWVFGFRF